MHCGFGDPIHIDEPWQLGAVALHPRPQCPELQRLPTKDHGSQRMLQIRALPLSLDELRKSTRGLAEYRYFLSTHQFIEFPGRAGYQIRHNYDSAAVKQSPP